MSAPANSPEPRDMNERSQFMPNLNNCPRRLTVIIRNETPLQIEEPCSYRRVTIDLTDAQIFALELQALGSIGTEQISRCFLEFNPPRKNAT